MKWKKMEVIDKNKSLKELTVNSIIDETMPPRAFELYRAPLKDLDDDDVRYMISMQCGLKFMIPLALDLLAENPMLGVSYYDGDLLSAVLSPPAEFWKENPELWHKTEEVVSAAEDLFQAFKFNVLPKIGHFHNVKPPSE